MKETQSSIAKITPPRISGLVQRERLFSALDKGLEKPLLWVTAPAGSGKTSLLASYENTRNVPCLWYSVDRGDTDLSTFFYYMGIGAKAIFRNKKVKPLPLLTSEYLMDVPTFTRRYFEELCERRTGGRKSSTPAHFLIVLDNYQEAPSDSPFHEMIRNAVEALPAGVSIACLSRSDAPPEFARLKANNRMRFIGWRDLRFTKEEINEAVSAVRKGRCLQLSCPGPERLYEKTDGWAAGLRLMIEALAPRRMVVASSPPDSPVCHCVESLAWQEDVFSYFASEVMERTEPSIRDFLMITSFLPSITAALASSLSGRQDAAAILSGLSRRHYFTDWYPGPVPVYRYHPLFREFLQSRALRRYDAGEIARIRWKAADCLGEAGFQEDAIEILCELHEFDRAVELILPIGRQLIGQGRRRSVEQWISALPEAELTAHPGLLHIAGLCKLPVNLGEAKTLLEQAFHLFDSRKEYDPAVHAAGCVLEAIIIEGSSYEAVDQWIDRLDALVRDHGELIGCAVEQVSGIVLFALAYRDLNHASLPFWREKAEGAIMKTSETAARLKLCNYLMAYYMFKGDYTCMNRVMAVVRPLQKETEGTPVLRLLCMLLEAYHAVYALGEDAKGIALARKGIEIGNETGIGIYQFWFYYLIVIESVVTGQQGVAEDALTTLTASSQGLPPVRHGDLYILAGVAAMGRKAWSEAVELFSRAMDNILQSGATYSVTQNRTNLAKALFEARDEKAAREQLALAAGERWTYAESVRYQGLMALAYFDLKKGAREEGHVSLREALRVASSKGILMVPFFDLKVFSLVCAEALSAGIEPEFVRELIRKHRLTPPTGSAAYAWPWPIKIFTFGRFEIVKDDYPVGFSGKVQKKPIELLKALIAFGGKNVPEERIMDALWPDADGDASRTVLKSNLHRLRQGLGDEEFIALKDGRLSLSEDRCWVDALAFLSALDGEDEMSKLMTRGKVVSLYKGSFLPDDESLSWSVSMRERTRRLFVRSVVMEAERLLRAGHSSDAAEHYEKAVEAEELDEDLYCRLMECYGRMGRRDKVAGAFDRCRKSLLLRLDIVPSEQTLRLYERLMAENK